MVTKNTFKNKFPDVKVQKLQTAVVFSKREVEKTVVEMCKSLNTGLLYFSYAGKWITAYTSYKMKTSLDSMTKGACMIDKQTDKEVTILSDEPFFVGGEYCIRIQFPDGSEDVYSCEYFID